MAKQETQYSIGQVAKITGIETHTIRFWSGQLPEKINPIIGKGSRRYYAESHIKALQEIQNLIQKKGYTISMLKKGLQEVQHNAQPTSNANEMPPQFLQTINNLQNKVQTLLNLYE